MQTYRCPTCERVLYFHNLRCSCGSEVQLDPVLDEMTPLTTACANRAAIACNWRAEDQQDRCLSCATTRTHPDVSVSSNAELWSRAELAKRWVLSNLIRLGWFRGADRRPVFDLLSERTLGQDVAITMGHADGVITINVSEVSESLRTQRREELEERYRTMIGHFRHEIAHFLFFDLSGNADFISEFRRLFGDERTDYAAALQRHYDSGGSRTADPAFITPYAAAHPHEDWAETSAHLLHQIDLVDSATAVGIQVPSGPPPGLEAYRTEKTDDLLSVAGDLSLAINHVNRSLDLPDLYPFVIADEVRAKLHFAHQWLLRGASPRTEADENLSHGAVQ